MVLHAGKSSPAESKHFLRSITALCKGYSGLGASPVLAAVLSLALLRRSHDKKAIDEIRTQYAEHIERFIALQYLFDRQWTALKVPDTLAHANPAMPCIFSLRFGTRIWQLQIIAH